MTKPPRAAYWLSPSMKPAGTTRGNSSVPASPSPIISCRLALSFAMSRAVVTPAAMCRPPSQRDRWLCMSNSPGNSTRPAASTTWSAPALAALAGRIERMRPRETLTPEGAPSVACSLSKTRALRISVTPASG